MKWIIGVLFIFTFLAFNIFSATVNKDYIIVLHQQINPIEFNNISGKESKSFAVWNTSLELAKNSQKKLIQFLEKEKIKYHSFHIINAIKIIKPSEDIIHKLDSFEEIK